MWNYIASRLAYVRESSYLLKNHDLGMIVYLYP